MSRHRRRRRCCWCYNAAAVVVHCSVVGLVVDRRLLRNAVPGSVADTVGLGRAVAATRRSKVDCTCWWREELKDGRRYDVSAMCVGGSEFANPTRVICFRTPLPSPLCLLEF